jgi:hypothetical protein
MHDEMSRDQIKARVSDSLLSLGLISILPL